MKKIILLIFIFLSANTLATPRRVYPLRGEAISKSSYHYELSLLHSVTLSRYDIDGNEVPLDEEENFSLTDFNFGLNYGFGDKLTIGGSLKYRQLSNENTQQTLSTSGVESFGLNFRYELKKRKSYRYSLYGEYRMTPYENEIYDPAATIPTGEIVLGDSGQTLEFGLIISYIYTKWTTMEIIMGYRTPANDISPELPYDFRFIKNFNSWAIWAGVRGVYSLGLDNYSENPEQKPLNANGGVTYRWNSIDRSFMTPYAGIRFLVKQKYRISMEGGQTMSGTSTDQAFDARFALSWNYGGKTREQKIEGKFKEYVSEATVVKVSPRGKFVKIDKGLAHDIAKGNRVDFYKADYFGGNILVAAGTVYEAGPSWAIVKITNKYRKMPIEKGLVARIK
jgi:hypothetical protein